MSKAQKVRDAFANQVEYCRANGAPITARIVEAIMGAIDGNNGVDSEVGRRILGWDGDPLADALPLRIAGGFHALHLSGQNERISAIYNGDEAAFADAEQIISKTIASDEAALLPWLDSPPQTNEAGRSSSYIAGLLWLTARGLPPCYELLEIGSSAGLNLLIERYHYDLGGVCVGPDNARLSFKPEWQGPPPPRAPFAFESIRGCDIAPVDLADPAQARRLTAYIWPEHTARFERMKTAIDLVNETPPRLEASGAGGWMARQLARPQKEGVTRVLIHSIVWQYIPEIEQNRINRLMDQASAKATPDRPLAWLSLEANRGTHRHELHIKHWPGDGQRVKLGEAHAHGEWVKWLGV